MPIHIPAILDNDTPALFGVHHWFYVAISEVLGAVLHHAVMVLLINLLLSTRCYVTAPEVPGILQCEVGPVNPAIFAISPNRSNE